MTVQFRDWLVPNFNDRPRNAAIDCLVIHHTGGGTIEGALLWWSNPKSQASAHYLIDRDGTVYRCVSETHRAWHAGQSELAGREDVNSYSLGIELLGDDSSAFPAAQINALVELCQEITARYPAIVIERIVGHQDVARPVGRKSDPGPKFPWKEFRARLPSAAKAPIAKEIPDPDIAPDQSIITDLVE
jgi:N-acetylmuramoyl-L-alanine amidase